MRRLSRRPLPELPRSARQPQYDRERLQVGMAHISVGAFHRCHRAEFIDDMLEARFGRWGVLGVNLTAPSLADLLIPQDCLYSRTLRQDARAETRIIGALRRVIDVADKPSAEAAVAALGGPEISVATMTVTEKGYCLIPSTGALDPNNPALRADLDGAFPPRTLLGLLALALERRRQTGGAPLTLISCDNVPSNSARLGAAMLEFGAFRSAALTRWIEERVMSHARWSTGSCRRPRRKISDWAELAKSVLAIAPIFGTDMARSQLIEPVARHLRGLLEGGALGCLTERFNDE